MNLKRQSALLAVVVASAVTLAACGSDDNTAATGGAVGKSSNVQCGGQQTLKASGSTAQANAMSRFAQAFGTTCKEQEVNYNGNGSGAGIKEFLAKQTDFAGSDSPLSAEKGEVAQAAKRCGGAPAWNLPMVFGPIAITYNLDGVHDLALDGPTLAKVFSGKIKQWNDPAIAKLNKGKRLPNRKITVIFRSDESGTTDNFQKYLSTAGSWNKGDGKTFNGGVGEGAKGNDGTSQALKNTKGAITYNEWSFAQAQKLSVADIVNAGGGSPVKLNGQSAAKAVAAARTEGNGNDLRLDLNSIYGTKTKGAYPLMLATYEVVCSKYQKQDTAKAVKAFLSVAAQGGQQGLDSNGYVQLPKQFSDKLMHSVDAIK